MKVLKSALALAVAIFAVGCVTTSEDVHINIVQAKDQAVMEVIMSRRSIRDYKSEAVDREQMAKVIECGIYAPSAMNQQPWAVRVVDDKEFLDGVTAIAVEKMPQLKEQEGFRNFFRNAPTVAFIACPVESYSGEYDCGLLSENMMQPVLVV